MERVDGSQLTSFSRTRPRLVLVLTVLFGVAVGPLLLRVVEPIWDAHDLGYPSFTYAVDAFRAGRLPLWDPYSNCGYPFLAEPGTPAWSPLTPIIGLLIHDAALGFVVFWLLHWWWAGLGMLRWAGRQGAGELGAIVAAASYSFSGFFIAHAEHTSIIIVAAWLPWVFSLAEEAVESTGLRRALLAGAAFGLMCLSGYPGLMSVAGLALALWLGAGYLVGASSSREGLWFRLRSVSRVLLVIGVVAVVIWSPSLLLFFTEGRGYADRTEALSPIVANYFGPFPPSAFFSLFFPFSTIDAIKVIPTDVSMSNGYVGALTLPLAATWLLRRGAGPRSWGFVAFVLFMVALSIGGRAGLRTVLYYVYPPMRFIRFSAPFRVFWMLALCLAAGHGLALLRADADHRSRFGKLLLGWSSLGLATAGGYEYFRRSTGVPLDQFVPLYLPALVILGASILVSLAWRRRLTTVDTSVLMLVALVLLDSGAHLYVNQFTVWRRGDSLLRAEAARQLHTQIAGDPGPRQGVKPNGFFNAHLVSKTAVTRNYATMKSNGFDTVLTGDGSRFVEVLQGAPRFWLTPSATPLVSTDAALETLRGVGAGEPLPVFVDAAVAADLRQDSVVPGTFGIVRTTRYAPETVDLSVEVPIGPGAVLASTERLTPGWRVSVDGVDQAAISANVYFRGVRLSSGHHVVRWRYGPAGFRTLFAVAILVLLASIFAPLLAVAEWLLRRSRVMSP